MKTIIYEHLRNMKNLIYILCMIKLLYKYSILYQ